MSFSFLSGRTFTELLAGFAFTSIVSPGRNGFGTFFRALCEGFFTTLIAALVWGDITPTARAGQSADLGAVTRVRWAQPGPHPTSESALYAIRTPCRSPSPGPWTPSLPMDAKSAPTGSLENREERGFPQRPPPSSSSSSRSTREHRGRGRAHRRMSRVDQFFATLDTQGIPSPAKHCGARAGLAQAGAGRADIGGSRVSACRAAAGFASAATAATTRLGAPITARRTSP